jgi:tetratricopeptide (TPR) repeat protein
VPRCAGNTASTSRSCRQSIQHTGYQDPALRGKKLERDLRLLNLENTDKPDDPFTLFNLGSVYQELGKLAEAIPFLQRSLQRSNPSDSIVRKLYALIAQCYRQLKQQTEALAVCREGRLYYPDDTELLFQESLCCRDLGDHAASEACLVRLLTTREQDHFASIDTGLRGYKARHNLAVLYQEQRRLPEAEAHWQQVLAEQPHFAPALLGLAEVYLVQGRWSDLDRMAAQMESRTPGTIDGLVLRARGQLARREFAEARSLLENAVTKVPQSVWARRVLTHVLLQQGSDPEAAERCLRELLVLVPDDVEARNNLALLLDRQAR